MKLKLMAKCLAATLSSDLTSGNNTAAALETAINANSNTHGSVATAFNKLTSSKINIEYV